MCAASDGKFAVTRRGDPSLGAAIRHSVPRDGAAARSDAEAERLRRELDDAGHRLMSAALEK
jgi:hypothetical protein